MLCNKIPSVSTGWCLIGKQKKPILFEVTESMSISRPPGAGGGAFDHGFFRACVFDKLNVHIRSTVITRTVDGGMGGWRDGWMAGWVGGV
jgi:hypothetical protein